MLDESRSIDLHDFKLIKAFLLLLVARLDIDSGSTRVGFVSYATKVDLDEDFNLNRHKTLAQVQEAVSAFTRNEGSTGTSAALEYVRTKMLISAAGDRGDVPNVVVVLTDGNPNNVEETRVCSI